MPIGLKMKLQSMIVVLEIILIKMTGVMPGSAVRSEIQKIIKNYGLKTIS